jgi:hypothetical protein
MAWGESQTTAGRTSQSETEADKQGQEGKHWKERWLVSISLLNTTIQVTFLS